MTDLSALRAEINALARHGRVLLDTDAATHRQHVDAVLQLTERFHAQLPHMPAYFAGASTDAELQSLKVTDTQQSLSTALRTYQRAVMQRGVTGASANHVAFIPGGGIALGALGDYIASITNEYVGVQYGSPGGHALEVEVLDVLMRFVGWQDADAVGTLTSGGSIANMIALCAARDDRDALSEKGGRAVVYMSEQTHHCIVKALRIIGLGGVQVRTIECDAQFRISVSKLRAAIEQDVRDGLKPFLLIGSAGTTDCGAVDPIQALVELRDEFGMWLHIDGAYGALFNAVRPQLFTGLHLADSLVVDPHKSLFASYGVGAVFVKKRSAVTASMMHTSANYMRDANFVDDSSANLSPELTRPFRGLRLWLPLQVFGVDAFKACMEEKLALTRYYRERLRRIDGFQVADVEPQLSVSYFWHTQVDTKQLFELTMASGKVFHSTTTINGRLVIRMAILSMRTGAQNIDLCVAEMERCANELKSRGALAQ